MHLRVNYLRLLLRFYLPSGAITSSYPAIGFLPISWWAHTVSGESDAHNSCSPQAGSRGLSPYYVCSFTYWSSYCSYIYFCIYTLPTCSASMYYYSSTGFLYGSGVVILLVTPLLVLPIVLYTLTHLTEQLSSCSDSLKRAFKTCVVSAWCNS